LELFTFISIFFAPDKLLAAYKYGIFILGLGLFWLIVCSQYDRLKLIWSFSAGVFIQAFLGIWQFLSQTSFASKWLGLAVHNPGELGASVVETMNGTRWLRAYGGLDHPNILGGVLAVSLLILIALIFNRFSNSGFKSLIFNERIFNGILYVFGFGFLLSLFFTFSRGAWAGFLTGVLAILIFTLLKKDKIKQMIILTVIFISVTFMFVLFNFYSDLVLTRLSKDTRLEIKSNFERLEFFREAAKIIKDNWLFGTGIGNYSLALAQEKKNYPAWDYQPVHNTFLLIWSEIGILGLLAFLGLLGYLSWILIKKEKLISFSIVVSLIVMMMADHWFWSLHFGILFFWLVLGLVVRGLQFNKSFHESANFF